MKKDSNDGHMGYRELRYEKDYSIEQKTKKEQKAKKKNESRFNMNTPEHRITEKEIRNTVFETSVKDNPLYEPIFKIIDRRLAKIFRTIKDRSENADNILPLRDKIREDCFMVIYRSVCADAELQSLLCKRLNSVKKGRKQSDLITELIDDEIQKRLESFVSDLLRLASLLTVCLMKTSRKGANLLHDMTLSIPEKAPDEKEEYLSEAREYKAATVRIHERASFAKFSKHLGKPYQTLRGILGRLGILKEVQLILK